MDFLYGKLNKEVETQQYKPDLKFSKYVNLKIDNDSCILGVDATPAVDAANKYTDDIADEIWAELTGREGEDSPNTRIDKLEEIMAGIKTAGGGEVFNDIDNNTANSLFSHAEGSNTSAGIKGFLIDTSKLDNSAQTYVLDSEDISKINSGDTYAIIVTKTKAESNGTIVFLNGGKIASTNNTTKTVEVDTYVASRYFHEEYKDSKPLRNPAYLILTSNPCAGDKPLGIYAHSEGFKTLAAGENAHAEGDGSSALGKSTHAEGQETLAVDSYAHAEGFKTTANAYASHAEGNESLAFGTSSHAEGSRTSAKYVAHAEGADTQANGSYSHAEGKGSIANGENSHAEGSATVTEGISSHSEGGLTKAKGNWSHAEGYYSQASGQGAHAEGGETEATGTYSHAEGRSTKATGYQAHSEGQNTHATGNSSHAEGNETYATGGSSHAEGQATQANHFAAHTEGEGTISNRTFQHVQGKYNYDGGNHIHVIGWGSKSGTVINRRNIHTIDEDGNAVFSGNVYVKATDAGCSKESAKKLVNESDIATSDKAGVVKVHPDEDSFDGIGITKDGMLGVVAAPKSRIDEARFRRMPVGVDNFAYAVRKALVNPTDRPDNDVVKLIWTASQQAAARKTLGIDTAITDNNVNVIQPKIDKKLDANGWTTTEYGSLHIDDEGTNIGASINKGGFTTYDHGSSLTYGPHGVEGTVDNGSSDTFKLSYAKIVRGSVELDYPTQSGTLVVDKDIEALQNRVTELEAKLSNVEAALDRIIQIQNQLIGGN